MKGRLQRRNVQTNMLCILNRASHLGDIVRTREAFFLTSGGNIASDEELRGS